MVVSCNRSGAWVIGYYGEDQLHDKSLHYTVSILHKQNYYSEHMIYTLVPKVNSFSLSTILSFDFV